MLRATKNLLERNKFEVSRNLNQLNNIVLGWFEFLCKTNYLF